MPTTSAELCRERIMFWRCQLHKGHSQHKANGQYRLSHAKRKTPCEYKKNTQRTATAPILLLFIYLFNTPDGSKQ